MCKPRVSVRSSPRPVTLPFRASSSCMLFATFSRAVRMLVAYPLASVLVLILSSSLYHSFDFFSILLFKLETFAAFDGRQSARSASSLPRRRPSPRLTPSWPRRPTSSRSSERPCAFSRIINFYFLIFSGAAISVHVLRLLLLLSRGSFIILSFIFINIFSTRVELRSSRRICRRTRRPRSPPLRRP